MSSFTFRQMTKQMLEDLFGLKRVREHSIMKEWLITHQELTTLETEVLTNLRESLLDRIEDWNEQELIMKFIGPVIALVNFDTEEYSSFAERPLAATIGEHDLSGSVDMMVATGRQTPKKPYFCLHEYKKEQGTENDPGGQALAAMLAAQHLNENEHPIYGAYVLGRNWFFMILQGIEYSISDEYAATKDEIFDIAKVLKTLKERIYQQVCHKDGKPRKTL